MRERQNVPMVRRLRQRETDLERRLWQELRNRQALGLKFRRQHPVGPYIVDFAWLDARLLIEIDGYWHTFRKVEDEARERELKATGFDIVRYDIENESADVRSIAEAIAHEARLRIDRRA
jgi:very-short-patch-repair endonuclease